MDASSALQSARSEILTGLNAREATERLLASAELPEAVRYRIQVALQNGSSLLACLDQQLALERERAGLERTLTRQFASSRLTAKLIVWLPLVSALCSQLLGLQVLSFLLFNPLGWVVLVLGIALNVAGWYWTRRIVAAVNTKPTFASAFEYDLIADFLESGLSVPQGIAALIRRQPISSQLEALLKHHRSRGYPLVPVLRDAAANQRNDERARLELELETLPNRLLLPTGVALLPAFLVLNVIPAAAAAFTAYR